MVGDDVVDLDDEAIAQHHLRARFLDRVLCPGERAALAAARSPKALLWSYFAAKEAAYKIVAKQTRSPIFAHRLFVVSDDLRAVTYEGQRFDLDVQLDDALRFVHAVATTRDSACVLRGVSDDGDGRALLCRAIAAHLGCAPTDLAVVRTPRAGSWDGFDPPRLLRNGHPIAIDVSLSHDGRFVSFAAGAARDARVADA